MYLKREAVLEAMPSRMLVHPHLSCSAFQEEGLSQHGPFRLLHRATFQPLPALSSPSRPLVGEGARPNCCNMPN
jgi:hypothetical protein